METSKTPAATVEEDEIANLLTADMTDSEIFNAIGISITDFDTEFIQGTDGTQYNYVEGDQSIKIVRSLVTGVRVMAHGPKLEGSWHIGRHPDAPNHR